MVKCGICFRKLPRESVSYLDCNHPFCVQCIAIWSSSYNSNHNACPTCRVPYLVSREQREMAVVLQSVLRTNITRTIFLSKKFLFSLFRNGIGCSLSKGSTEKNFTKMLRED